MSFHVENIKEIEEIYKSMDCSMNKMQVKYPNILDDLREFNVSDTTLKRWNEEYVSNHIKLFNPKDELSIQYLKRDIFINVDYSYTIELFDCFKRILALDTVDPCDMLEYLLDIHFSLYPGQQEPFTGFMGLAVYNKDLDRLNEMREIYINLLMKAKPKDGIDSYKIFIIFSLAYDLDYKLDDLNKKYLSRAKKAFEEDIEDGESLWPMVCYLTGIAVEENFKNAYRALKLTYDKYHEISDDFLNYLAFINYIAKINYTVDDVLRLESLNKEESMSELSEKIGLYPGEI